MAANRTDPATRSLRVAGEPTRLTDDELEELANQQTCVRTRYAICLALRYRRTIRRFINDGRLRG